MRFDPKKALEAWKKAKPITLMKTGISELLRALPADPDQAQLAAYAAALTKLDAALQNSKIKAEKKALACLQGIRNDLNKYLKEIKDYRGDAITAVKAIHGQASQFHKDVSNGPKNTALVARFNEKMASVRRTWHTLSMNKAVVPSAQSSTVGSVWFAMDEAVRIMETLLQDAASGKPRFDAKAGIPKQLAKLKWGVDKLPPISSALAALKP